VAPERGQEVLAAVVVVVVVSPQLVGAVSRCAAVAAAAAAAVAGSPPVSLRRPVLHRLEPRRLLAVELSPLTPSR
jgi:hypothetical protein